MNWCWWALRSLCCDLNGAIGVASCNIHSTWNCGMLARVDRVCWTLAIGDWWFCPSKISGSWSRVAQCIIVNRKRGDTKIIFLYQPEKDYIHTQDFVFGINFLKTTCQLHKKKCLELISRKLQYMCLFVIQIITWKNCLGIIACKISFFTQKRPFVHNSVCSQFLEGLFAILAECSQFCLRPF